MLWLVCLPAACGAPSTAPRLVCDAPLYDFGVVTNRAVVEHTFVLRNAGREPVRIGEVKTTCGCTTAALVRRRLDPGESADLTARFSLKGRRGPQHKSIYVHSDDPARGKLALSLKGSVVRSIDTYPRAVTFGPEVKEGQEKSVIVMTPLEQGFQVVGIETRNASFFTAGHRAVVPGRRYEVWVRLNAAGVDLGGFFRGSLVIATDREGFEAIEVPVTLYVPKEIVVAPRELYVTVPRNDDQRPVTRYVFVRSTSRKAFEVEAVEPPLPQIRAEVRVIANGTVRLGLDGIPANEDLEGRHLKIVVRIEGGEEQTLLVPFRIRQPGG